MNKEQTYSNIVVQLRGGSEYLETIELTETEQQIFIGEYQQCMESNVRIHTGKIRYSDNRKL